LAGLPRGLSERVYAAGSVDAPSADSNETKGPGAATPRGFLFCRTCARRRPKAAIRAIWRRRLKIAESCRVNTWTGCAPLEQDFLSIAGLTMRSFLLFLAGAFVLAIVSCAHDVTDNSCVYDSRAMLALNEHEFNSTPDMGWRVLGNTPGCEGVAADLIATYRQEHPGIDDQVGLLHHEAQMRAASGQTEAAISLLREVRALESTPEMLAYRDAEIAFLSNDRGSLIAARERLATLPEPAGFAAAVERFRTSYPNFLPPRWPTNLDVVDGLIACFGRPYAEAYGLACRPERQP